MQSEMPIFAPRYFCFSCQRQNIQKEIHSDLKREIWVVREEIQYTNQIL